MKRNLPGMHLLFTCLLFSTSAFQLNAATYYVTPTGAGSMNGVSWANAAAGATLQTVIDAALPGDQVWVACGEYLTTTNNDRSISFHMRSGIAIYGSFQGTEAQLAQRVLSCGPCSILSGEIGAASNTDNSYTVVWNEDLDSTAVLDGFRITGGNDDRSPTSDGQGLGGGLYNHGYGSAGYCHPVIRNCVFDNNRASWGGGAFNNGYASGNSEPTYINCIFDSNHAYIEAGGMDSYGVGGNASPTLYNCLFLENTAATNVGAMYAWGGGNGNCQPLLYNCAFVNNSAQNGYGGAFIADNLDENSSTSSGTCIVTLQNCVVWNNTATGVAPQFYVRGTGAQVVATYSDIDMNGQTGQNVITGPGTGNIDADPLFTDLSNPAGADACWMTLDDGLMPGLLSPLLEAGDDTGVWTTDLAGNQRVAFTVDIGPYERQVPVSIGAGKEEAKFQVAPNPATDWIEVTGKTTSGEAIRLFDAMGRELTLKRINGKDLIFDLSGLSPGLYFLYDGGASSRFVKE